MCSALANPSLWGKKATFLRFPCYWQLSGNCTVPPLEELSVCADIWRQIQTSDWTAFVYKTPGEQRAELGLAGAGGNLKAWLFGREWVVAYDLPLLKWHTVCLTWSGHSRRFQLLVNGTVRLSSLLNDTFPTRLTPGGVMTLGVSHSFVGGVLVFESGTNLIGEITLFRMWAQELSAQQLAEGPCVSGDIVTWTTQDWESVGCPAVTDDRLTCEWSKYKINMKLSVAQTSRHGLIKTEVKAVVLQWLESILPQNVSVDSVFLSTLSQASQKFSSVHEHNTKIKEIKLSSDREEWIRCLVYVTVSPAAVVNVTQAELWTELIAAYNHSAHIILQTDPASINILPVAGFPESHLNSTISDFEDKFFRVYMNLTVNGSVEDPAQMIRHWVLHTLEQHQLTVLHFKLTRNPHYGCTFQTQAKAPVNATQTGIIIFQLLTKGFSNDSLTIYVPTNQINILLLEPGFCPEDATETVYGLYSWPPIQAQETYDMVCEKGQEAATRFCRLDDRTDAAIWDPPDLSKCEKIITDIEDLENIKVTANNSADVVDMIEDLLSNQTDLSSSQLSTVLEKLSEVTDMGAMTTQLADSVINVVSCLFDSTPFLANATNKVVSITDQVGNRVDFPGDHHNATVPSLALQLLNVDPASFRGLTFGVSSFQTGLPPEIFLSHEFAEQGSINTVASISLPTALDSFFPQNNNNRSRIQFHFYGTGNLFQDPYSDLMLNSYVVSASVTNASVNNLTDPVLITLQHLQSKEDQDIVQCVYWDLKKNGERGGWDDSGCRIEHTSVTHTSCLCLHLTHFGVLLDISKTPINPRDDMILTLISNLCCGVSSVFLSITLLTYIFFGKLRCDYPSKILINLSLALLGLNLLFLVNAWLASFNIYGLCIAVAAVLHYFFLASFTWMALEAINMYLAFVKVFNVYVSYYILKFCIVGWGLPLVIVSIVLAIDKDCYGGASSLSVASAEDSSFCWVRNDAAFYVAVVAFVALVLVGNTAVLGMVLVQIHRMHGDRTAGRRARTLRDLRVVASLTFLLGLTWVLAFFALGPMQVPLLYLFSFLNGLQGVFIFFFHCVMKDNVRKQWRTHLCCGQFRLTDYSAQSGTLSQDDRVKSGKVQPSGSTNDRKTSGSSETSQKLEAWKLGPRNPL
ncbi:adhesion G protein-coupled receptor G4a isoform X3 [Brachyhypopomus gauderio]|uniref:adhesion G protein-coupled receptor G4a isoform X3 n=1 Tax=Brachyhypopomus gauderio TaxID=698409 RepID=UPI004041759F